MNRSTAGRLGALAQQSRHDTRDTTRAARVASWERFAVIVDPSGTLAPAERERRAQAARRAHYVRMAAASVAARRKAA